MAKIRIENTERDTKTIEVLVSKPGEPRKVETVKLGSTHDKAIVDPKVAKPEQVVDAEFWRRAKDQPAVKGWLDRGQVRELGAA